ncbi:hypothetical protein B0H19DRAFT_1069603 [Mycena capillaripes]|nr:hypothetical protein B0H19DRAFT_1069603 [Mycena capillaripes]
MDVYLDGNIIPASGFSDDPRTINIVCATLARNLRLPRDKRLLLTTVIPTYGSFTTLVHVEFKRDAEHPLILGSKRASHLRESLIFAGHTPSVLREDQNQPFPANLEPPIWQAIKNMILPSSHLVAQN